MAFENGVNWKPLAPAERGRHATFSSAIEAAAKEMLIVHDTFFDSLADRWPKLFPGSPARPGRFEDGKIFLYVRSASVLFAFRPKLAAVRRRLAELPDAPKRLELALEIHR